MSPTWEDIALEVWDRWCKFTENDDRKQTLVIWQVGRQEKVAEVSRVNTAFYARDLHNCVIVHGGYVKLVFIPSVNDSSSSIAATAFRHRMRTLKPLSH
jgi:hypothetical protein